MCGGKGNVINGTLVPFANIGVGTSASTSGVLLRLRDVRWFDEYNEDEHTYDPNDWSKYETVTAFITFTPDGKQSGEHLAEHRKAICAVSEGQFVFIKNRNYVWSWKGGGTEPVRIGRIEFKDMPPADNIRSFALSKDCLTLSTRFPSALVFLCVKRPAMREEDMGSIVLGKKRKTPDE